MFSYVDPILNTAVLSQIDLRRDLAFLFQLKFPEAYLPTFLHEGTHHSCFSSPLGNALALLRMRAYRTAALFEHGSDESWDVLEDVLRQEITMEVLRPLAEGLACFSELDEVPGKSRVLTVPMASAFFNFGGIDHEFKTLDRVREHGVGLFLFSLLYSARLHPNLTQRRENVLASSFSYDSGGYLCGYMALKNIWLTARRQSDLAAEGDLFSAYVRSYFYDDYAFVATILDFSHSEHLAGQRIGDYFLARLKQLLTLDWETSLAAFAEQYGGTEINRLGGIDIAHTKAIGLNNDGALCDVGRRRLEDLVLGLSKAAGPAETSMCRRDERRLRKRELLCLGSLEAEVEVNSSDRVLARAVDGGVVDGLPNFVADTLPGVRQGTSRGSVEFYLIPAENSRASAIVRDGELVHVNFEGPISQLRQDSMKELFGTRSLDVEELEEQEAGLERFIEASSIHLVRDQAKVTSSEMTEKIYAWLSTMHVDEDRWESAVKKLKEGGLYEVCGGDHDFIKGFAFLGVSSSVCRSKAELIEFAREQGIDVPAICEKARMIEAAVGLPLIRATPGMVTVVI